MRVSKFGLISVLSFIVLAFLGRLFFPFADEPDWIVRAPGVLFGEHPIWSPYSLFAKWFNSLDIHMSRCQLEADAFSFFGHIPYACNDELSQVVIRWLILLFILLPFFYISIFRRSFIKLMNLINVELSDLEWNLRIDALGLSLIFPSMLYYIGVLAEEQLYLVVALYLFLFWGFWKVIVGIFLVLISIDFGNSIVVLFFVLSMVFFTKLNAISRRYFFVGVCFFIFSALFFGHNFLILLMKSVFFYGDFYAKSEAIYSSIEGGDLLNKYPIFLRPIITFMSFIFMTPSGLKIPFLYIIVFLYFCFVSMGVFKKSFAKLDVYWIVPVSVIVFFVFMFPTYANAKYYIFMMPFFIYVSLCFYSRERVYIFSLFSSFFVIFSLILYRF